MVTEVILVEYDFVVLLTEAMYFCLYVTKICWRTARRLARLQGCCTNRLDEKGSRPRRRGPSRLRNRARPARRPAERPPQTAKQRRWTTEPRSVSQARAQPWMRKRRRRKKKKWRRCQLKQDSLTV